jgi:hypothetical protein
MKSNPTGPRSPVFPPGIKQTENTTGPNKATQANEVKKTETVSKPNDVYGVKPAMNAVETAQSKPVAKPIEHPADFVDIGLGPTGMMQMLETIAAGHTALGVELRGDPILGVHQNIRVDWYHQLGKIDEAMEKKYGADRIPIYPPTGKPFKLAEVFFRPELQSGALDWPEIYRGDLDPKNGKEQNIGGRIHNVAFEDARAATKAANGGKANVVELPPPAAPDKADPTKVRQDMKEILDGPSTFQAAISNYTGMLRKYLELMEAQDRERGLPPRAQIITNARVTQDEAGKVNGFIPQADGKQRILIEKVTTENVPGQRPKTIRQPGTEAIDLGVPKLFSITTGASVGPEAKSLGYVQKDVAYTDPKTGQSLAAQQNWIVGEVSANVGGQLIRRISTATDPETGEQQTVRQITVGHESADRIAWTLIQVPDFVSFDPIKAGKVPEGTSPKSPEFAKAAQDLVYHYFLKEAAGVLHIPPEQIREMRMIFGPNAFTLTERLGDDAKVAANGVVSGDLMGNGHFLTSGGSMTGMIGHGQRVGQFWQNLDKGMEETKAMRTLADGIRTDTQAWLHVSAKEFFDVLPVNFGEERAKALHLAPDNTEVKKPRQPNLGLEGVLGANNWAQALKDLAAGKFGAPKVDYYVPEKEVDVKNNTHLPDPNVPFFVRTRPPPPAYHVD